MIVLGIDSGLATFGLSAVELTPESERLVFVDILTTEPSPKKLNVLASDDLARRVRELAKALREKIQAYSPGAIALESPSWPRNAGAAAKMGASFGMVYAMAQEYRLPIVQASPQAIKKAVVGNKSASKDEVICAIERRFPDVAWPSRAALWEHGADAIGVVVACLGTDVLQMARRIPA